MNITAARKEFSIYYQDVKAEQRREGATGRCAGLDRDAMWEAFIEKKVEDGEAPKEARNWKLK